LLNCALLHLLDQMLNDIMLNLECDVYIVHATTNQIRIEFLP